MLLSGEDTTDEVFIKKMKIATKFLTPGNEKVEKEIEKTTENIVVKLPEDIENECDKLLNEAKKEFVFKANHSSLSNDAHTMISNMVNNKWLNNFGIDEVVKVMNSSSSKPSDVVILSTTDANCPIRLS